MLALALGRITGLRLIGELADGREGLEFCLREKPDLLVVDLFLPGMHGLEIVKIVREKLPATRILVLTSHPGRRITFAIDSPRGARIRG